MPVTVVVGAQYGDEGKGRIVDFLSGDADIVIRFQGGDNAGHTVVNQHGEFRLHLVPSGIFHARPTCLIGAGAVVNPAALLRELAELQVAGIDTSGLLLADRAQMLLPHHRVLDGMEEEDRGEHHIGTTSRGIGPAYSQKATRSGVRVGDLQHPQYLRARLQSTLPSVNRSLSHFGAQPVELEPLLAQCAQWAEELAGRIVDPIPLLRRALQNGRHILLEGQLGAMKDLDWGTYPFVTSSNPTAGFAAVGAGLPPQQIGDVLGVAKAYQTSVGAGPFPGELTNHIGDRLRDIGGEYGATTGRPRRTGWYDAVAVRHAVWLNGMTALAVTKLDVLDTFAEIKLCNAYRLPDGTRIDYVPDTPVLEQVEPMLESWPGWQRPTTSVRTWEDLPAAARRYLERLQELADVPVRYISVGAERNAMFRT
ncbi:MAG: adenylosuccinate synthase [Anaerolineales bacterium]|nr:adenylosuccinate synthase [Anaerolineales bacterium]